MKLRTQAIPSDVQWSAARQIPQVRESASNVVTCELDQRRLRTSFDYETVTLLSAIITYY